MTSILGHAELALLDLPDNATARNSIAMLVTSARCAAELTNQMLAYAGRGRFMVERLQLNELITKIADLLQVSISRQSRLEYRLDDHLPMILADSAQIRQVVMNLLVNASEALGDQGGVITLSTAVEELTPASLSALTFGSALTPGPYICLMVADTGCGMDAATLGRIFDPFFTTKFTGRGLGLAVVHGIVLSHKGALQVTSRPGAGTCFRIWLPVANIVPAVDAVPTRMLPSVANGSILVIDDEEHVRSVTVRLLQRLGFTVYMAADGPAGLELLQVGIPDLVGILIDLTMPLMRGDQVVRTLRERGITAPVVLMSGFSSVEVAHDYASLELAGFLQKPFTLDALCAALKSLTG